MKKQIRVITFPPCQNQGVNVELGTHTLEAIERVAEQNSRCIGPWFKTEDPSPTWWAKVGSRYYKVLPRGKEEVIYISQDDVKNLPDPMFCLFQKNSKGGLMTYTEFQKASKELLDSRDP